MNGWAENNGQLRQHLITYNDPDIICLTEIHLKGDDKLWIDGYSYYGLNRKTLPTQRGSGGVGILVNHNLAKEHVVNGCYKLMDNVISVRLTNKISREETVVFCVYLPPDGSKYSKGNETILNKLTIEMYQHGSADYVYVCGDFNAQIGELNDDPLNTGIGINKHIPVDLTLNQQGQKLINFVSDIKGCILNGRIDVAKDFFTSVARHKGKAVVDYHISRQSDINAVKEMEVVSCIELIAKKGWEHLLSNHSHVSDHNLITMAVETLLCVNNNFNDKSLGGKNNLRAKVRRKVGVNYMTNDVTLRLLDDLLADMDSITNCQLEVDRCYSNAINFVLKEVNESCKDMGMKRKKTKFKEYWDSELSAKWKMMHECERIYQYHKKKKIQGGSLQIKWDSFKRAQSEFDQLLRKKKHAYNKGMMINIEKCDNCNPRKFWDYIKRLGPTKHKDIPWEVEINGELVTDKAMVLEKWRTDFKSLYKFTDTGFNDDFREGKMQELIKLRDLNEPDTAEFNRPLTYREVKYAIESSKNKKAIGIDLILNELMKKPAVIRLFYKFFSVCWKYELIPSKWRQAIIHPIPKMASSSIDLLKYRGLALQSCVYKILSNIINLCITNYLEQIGEIEDKQNGFRRNRSCLHHIHTLHTILNGQLAQGDDTILCFIDFRKAFDVTDRNLLYYNFASCGIRGKILNMIERIYQETENVIRINGMLSNTFTSEQGLRQEDNLSPVLFSLYINGLLRKIKESKLGVNLNGLTIGCLAYADDLVLVAHSGEHLQEMLNLVQDWCKQWRVLINVDKSKIMHVRKRSRKLDNRPFCLGAQKLETVSHYKYLGVLFDQHLTMEPARDQLSKAGSRALGQVIGKTRDNFDLGYHSFSKLFSTCMAPVLDYGNSVWAMG